MNQTENKLLYENEIERVAKHIMLCFQCKDVCSSHADMCSYVSTDQLTIGVKSLRNYNIQRDKLRENATEIRENGLKERVSEKRGKMSSRGQRLFSFLGCH